MCSRFGRRLRVRSRANVISARGWRSHFRVSEWTRVWPGGAWASAAHRERFLLGLILLVAALNGLLHVFRVPPWQHYDEPGHYEYVWLLVNRGRIPARGEHDQAMRREVLGTMIEHDFFRSLGPPPNLLQQGEPLWIPFPQTGDRPFYYLLTALVVRPLRHTDMITQLYAARLASLALYLVSILLAYALVGELVPSGHHLRLAVPAFTALLPAYTDLMTAVNNDVGAVVVFTLFLWGGVRLLVRGVSPARLVWVVGAAALCLWTKNTVAVALPLLGLLLVMVLLRRGWSWRRLLLLPAIGLAALPLFFSWGDAAYWYRLTDQPLSLRQRVEGAPLGQHALALELDADRPGRQVINFVLPEQVEALRGQTVTLGAWMWASQPVTVRSPRLGGANANWPNVELGTAPAFYAFTATVAPDARSVHIVLQPLADRNLEAPVTVYYDGLVLAGGERPADEPPRFDDPNGRTGTWGGRPFVNPIRNPSAEQGWPWVRPWVVRAIGRFVSPIPLGPFDTLNALLDWERTGRVHGMTARRLLESFWAVFGWGGVMVDRWWYRVLTWVTWLGLSGALVRLGRLMRGGTPPGPRWAVLFLGTAGLLVWGVVFLRPLPLYPWNPLFIPVARYAYPAIVPAALALVAGWTVWPWPRPRRWSLIVLFALLVALNLASLGRIGPGQTG